MNLLVESDWRRCISNCRKLYLLKGGEQSPRPQLSADLSIVKSANLSVRTEQNALNDNFKVLERFQSILFFYRHIRFSFKEP